MAIEYHNLMEDFVLQHIDAIMDDGGCLCDTCRLNIITYALNHLTPRYVSSDQGRALVKLFGMEPQFRTDVVAALSEARQVVRANPYHKDSAAANCQ